MQIASKTLTEFYCNPKTLSGIAFFIFDPDLERNHSRSTSATFFPSFSEIQIRFSPITRTHTHKNKKLTLGNLSKVDCGHTRSVVSGYCKIITKVCDLNCYPFPWDHSVNEFWCLVVFVGNFFLLHYTEVSHV